MTRKANKRPAGSPAKATVGKSRAFERVPPSTTSEYGFPESKFTTQGPPPRAVNEIRAAWWHFGAWCTRTGLRPLPATIETLHRYVQAQRDTKTPGELINLRIRHILTVHQHAEHALPLPRSDITKLWGDK